MLMSCNLLEELRTFFTCLQNLLSSFDLVMDIENGDDTVVAAVCDSHGLATYGK